MAFNPRTDNQTSSGRPSNNTEAVKPKIEPVLNDSTRSKPTGVYNTKEAPGKMAGNAGVYDQPVRKAGSMFVKVGIAILLVVIAGIILQLIF